MLLIEKKTRNNPGCFVHPSVFIREGGFTVKNLLKEEERLQAYHLRHRIFCQELGWVPQSENALEMDDYDKNAVFFGVFNKQNNLLAFLRLVMPESPFMLETEFSSLIAIDYTVRKERDTAEVSRLCVAPEARNDMINGNFGIHSIAMFLYKGVYHWCIRNAIRYLYLVVEHKIYRVFCAKGFPCQLMGQPVTMADGIVAVAAIMDWRAFEVSNLVKKPLMIKWFSLSDNKHLTGVTQYQ